ncbi:MAG: hypothetical protein QOH96_845 [Blastocatellia bacterium]|nr:hypothetical protein [Blastocatellia bacterium]
MKKSRSILGLIALTTMLGSFFAVVFSKQIEELVAYGTSFRIGMQTPNPPKVESQSHAEPSDHVQSDDSPNYNRILTAASLDRGQDSEPSNEEKISGAIVGYDKGHEWGNGCAQNVLVRTLGGNAVDGGVRYVVFSYRYSCEVGSRMALLWVLFRN